jgi:hypothetical protein
MTALMVTFLIHIIQTSHSTTVVHNVCFMLACGMTDVTYNRNHKSNSLSESGKQLHCLCMALTMDKVL